MKLLPNPDSSRLPRLAYVYPDGSNIQPVGDHWAAFWSRGERLTSDGWTKWFDTPEDAAKALAEQGEGPCSLSDSSTDKLQIEEAVCAKLIARRDVGRAKYGATMDENLDKNELLEWLIHQQEELMDAAIYVEAAIRKLKKGG